MNPLAIAALVGGLVGSWSGLFVSGLYYTAEIAKIKNDQLTKENAALATYQDLYISEVARGDDLSASLSTTEAQLNQRTREVQHALQKATTGRACFNAATVGLLNHADHIDSAMPETASLSAAESGATASDTDVAGWIGDAKEQYNICRSRLDALIDFETGRPDER